MKAHFNCVLTFFAQYAQKLLILDAKLQYIIKSQSMYCDTYCQILIHSPNNADTQ